MNLKIEDITPNNKNPRIIKDKNFLQLVESLKEDPEFLEVKPIIVNKDYLILGGNMRYQAAKKLGYKEIPANVVDWPIEKQERFIIKDNTNAGEWDWDILANEWDTASLESWGVNLPSFIEVGKIDHFRDTDSDSNLPPLQDYKNSTTNTLILIYDDNEYKFAIETIKNLITEENNTPSKVIMELLKNANT